MKTSPRSDGSRWVAVVAVVGVVAAVAVVGFILIRNSVENQDAALLQNQADQVTELLQSALVQEGTSLTAIDAVAGATGGSASTFQAEAAPFAVTPGTSLALVRSGHVLVAAGHGLSAGQALPAALAAAVAGGGPGLFSTPIIQVGGRSFLALVVGGGADRTAVVLQSMVDPSATSKDATGPYTHINIALYATPTAQPGQLVITTARPLPLAGPVAKTYVPVGTSKLLVITSAKEPLAGRWPNFLPWVLLVVGLVLALALGAVTWVLGRREQYAQALVAQRTEELESSQHELVRRERLSAVGEMATMIGHELRNPLGAALNGLFLVRRGLGDDIAPEIATQLTMIENQTSRASTLADDLTAYMRERDPEVVEVSFGAVVDDVLEASWPPDGVEVAVDGQDLDVAADRLQFIQILTNLVTNAYQAMPDGGSLHIAASAGDQTTDIVVEDSGPGIEANRLLHHPARRHRARSRHRPAPGRGPRRRRVGLQPTRGRGQVHRPAARGRRRRREGQGRRPDRPPSPRQGRPHHRRDRHDGHRRAGQRRLRRRRGDAVNDSAVLCNRVLVADDDEVLRTSVVDILRTCGYAITEAGDGEAALTSLAQQPVDVLVLDLRMPKKSGDEVLAALTDPPVVVVVSAYAPEKELLEREGDKIFRYLRKPVPPARLLEVVSEALAHAERAGS